MADNHSEPLMLPGPAFAAGRRANEGLSVGGVTLSLEPEGGHGRGTAWDVWDGSVLAAKHVEHHAARLAGGRTTVALELGAGNGLAGMGTAAATGARAILTDHPDAMRQVRRSIEANQRQLGHLLEARSLDWEAVAEERWWEEEAISIVVAADCVWLESLVESFAKAMGELLRRHTGAIGVMAHEKRSERVDALAFGALEREGIAVEDWGQPPGCEHARGKIFELRLATPPRKE